MLRMILRKAALAYQVLKEVGFHAPPLACGPPGHSHDQDHADFFKDVCPQLATEFWDSFPGVYQNVSVEVASIFGRFIDLSHLLVSQKPDHLV